MYLVDDHKDANANMKHDVDRRLRCVRTRIYSRTQRYETTTGPVFSDDLPCTTCHPFSMAPDLVLSQERAGYPF